jgi:hypothetical protein
MDSVETLVTEDLLGLTDPDRMRSIMATMTERHKAMLVKAAEIAGFRGGEGRELRLLLALETPAAIAIIYADGTPHLTVSKVAGITAAAIPLLVKVYIIEAGRGRTALNNSFVMQRLRLQRGSRDWNLLISGLTKSGAFADAEQHRNSSYESAQWDDADEVEE